MICENLRHLREISFVFDRISRVFRIAMARGRVFN